jgi:class 3 adenylate cyclase/pSer/pThr/pTyr-binding forkhead associated (FHA) protein
MEQSPSQRLEELVRERARLDSELERCKELVTVLFVDIVGSTGFYDEHGDVEGLVMVQKCLDLLIPVVEKHGGMVVKTIGDAILARFCDPEAAVRSAVEMQRNLFERNRGRIPVDQIRVRVAINLGLALLKGTDVFGDVVNVASRIESAAEPTEIAISPSVYEKIRHLPDLPVRQKASGVELKGKLGKLDLYCVLWMKDEIAGPPPPRPSKKQLSIATGLHTNLAQLAQYGVGEKLEVSLPRLDDPAQTVVFGAQKGKDLPEVAVRFAIESVQADGTLGKSYMLDHPGVIVGQTGEITLEDDPLVRPQHARLTQLGEGVYVEDLSDLGGVFIRLRHPQRLKHGDLIQMGRQKLRFVDQANEQSETDRTVVMDRGATPASHLVYLVRLNSEEGELDRFELRGSEISFGRSKGTHTFPEDSYLSAAHARVTFRDGQYFLEDLGSKNGTFARIRRRALAHDGDTLMIGKHLLRIVRVHPGPNTLETDGT